jgi:hypothetical protein
MSFTEQQSRADPPLEQKQLYVASAGGMDIPVDTLDKYFALTGAELAHQGILKENEL